MSVFLSPGVFPREIDQSVLPTAVGPLRPAFIGTAKKGPLNEVRLITSAQQYIDTYGEPFPESYMGYNALEYLQEGNSCFIMRVAIEAEEGQPEELSEIAIDTSGSKLQGWGRLPLFRGIDYGRINLRTVDSDNPLVFHDADVSDVTYNDADLSTTEGATDADLNITGTYAGSIDDSYIMLITSEPSSGAIEGAGYQVIRNSDGEIVAEGILDDPLSDGNSSVISIGDGLSVSVEVTSGVLDINDTFLFSAQPNNRNFTVVIEGDATPTEYTMPEATYNTVESFITAANALVGSEDYLFVDSDVPQIRTSIAGQRIQLAGTAAFALECGVAQYVWDIPRSYLLGLDPGPYNITTQNNRVRMSVAGSTETKNVEFNVPVGINQNSATIAAVINAASDLWESFELTVPGGTTHVVVVMGANDQFDTLSISANHSFMRSYRFTEELNIPFPYTRSYRGFFNSRLSLPNSGVSTPSTPLSCEADPFSSDCVQDTSYFENVVGWLVAPSSGTWVDGLTFTLGQYTSGPFDSSGRYTLSIIGSQGEMLDRIQDISFDKRESRYIGNVVNPGTRFGGSNGNNFVNWEERPAFLGNDINLASYEVRMPAHFNGRSYSGQANGIPLDPAFSSELDSAVIGNPSISSGLYAFQNPEAIDINLLAIPGFSTGAVIGSALQVCESRGDVLYLVDPPFGLRPQQVVDWHNGMLLSDLSSAINSSYGALYWGWSKVFDQFSGQEIWIPPSGHVAAIFSRTARDTEQWFAPAGLRRGRLITAIDVEYSPTQGERDLLYSSGNAVNPIVKFPQDGITVWGQRTLQRSSTALDRINVRMLLIFIKKNLIRLARNFIFEPNDRVLWRQAETTIGSFMSDIQVRRGVTSFRVVVDESNNTPERIDRNELWITVFVQPTRTVEFVVLNIAIQRTGGTFVADETMAGIA